MRIMTVEEAIKILSTMPPKMELISAVDDEGNYFRKVPENWLSVEYFDSNLNQIHPDDISEFDMDELKQYAVIG